ncbi:hypothetical protein NE236_01470 [Actinoallomurus purpureus]|uniref:hypothetical protein n=1 Tax=Actinoallomurus purpureus TaxID=478114 RepID=UPI002093EBDF|nr:hypothetical protein [Actinoallomurus purpureus]MCO6003636.1 hypothetical protein [Actinoallomurus purpureus]
MRPEGADPSDPAGSGLVRTVAPYAGPAFEERMALCEDVMVTSPDLCHLSYYSAGVFHYGFDRPPGVAVARDVRMSDYLNAGRRLTFAVDGLDERLEAVATGRLIRTVLHAEEAVIYCHSVVPHEHLVAVARERSGPESVLPELPRVRAADRTVSELATALRAHVSLSTQNPGGWLTEGPPDRPRVAAPSRRGDRTLRGETDDAQVELLSRVVDPSILHYLAYHHGAKEFAVDYFDHATTARFFGHITSQERRRFYLKWGRRFPQLAAELAQVMRTVAGGRLLRVVLDVEQGAIYYVRLSAGRHLIGVTLDQSKVVAADDRVGRLAVDLA